MTDQPHEPQEQELSRQHGRGSGLRVVIVVAVFVALVAAIAFGFRYYFSAGAPGSPAATKSPPQTPAVKQACEEAQLELLDPNSKISSNEAARLREAIKSNCT